uniref:Uncharacterized protein n=2 Tax=Clytia hemisphaerica TaxID=252671 RepID=A0A7M5UXN9_9CNID
IGTSCFRNNPCGSDKRCVDNCNDLSVCVPLAVESLHAHVKEATNSSTIQETSTAIKAFDGNENSMFHSEHGFQYGETTHWIKAEFHSRVFIDYVVFVNRKVIPWHTRNSYIDLKTILSINGETTMSLFGNTGEFEIERRMFTCMRQADGIYAVQPQAVSRDAINIMEIWVYGAIL